VGKPNVGEIALGCRQRSAAALWHNSGLSAVFSSSTGVPMIANCLLFNFM
jgi:hypothetical protein